MKKFKGITLISLIITIIILSILISITTYSGIGVINQSKLTSFTTEMKIMQTQVNSIYQKYVDGDKINIDGTEYAGDQILNIASNSTSEITTQKNKIFQELKSDSGVNIDEKDDYKYWNNNLLGKLGIEGIKQEGFFVNIKKRSIISYSGLKYEGETYYTLNQLPDSLYNVEYVAKETEGLDWNKILKNATTPHPNQTKSRDIGVGTDGELVNLDYWLYKQVGGGTGYNLSGEEGPSNYTAGYIGPITSEGEITGTVPQYIKAENGEFLPVTKMHTTFKDNKELKIAPDILDTVTILGSDISSAYGTFSSCTNLVTPPKIPEGVTDIGFIFMGCTSLKEAPKLPSSIVYMGLAFYNCTNLTTAPEIPEGVTNMNETFYNCTNLTTAPVIPSSVTNMTSTFYNCISLSGDLVINANPTQYDGCLSFANNYAGSQNKKLFLSGSSTKLQQILNTKTSSNTTIEIKK